MKSIVHNFYKKNKRFKIELEDLEQEVELLRLQGKDIVKGLEDYCFYWRSDRCSSAIPLHEQIEVSQVAEQELLPKTKKILILVHQLLTPQEWTVWSSVVLLAMKQCDVADELQCSQGEVSKILARAQEKVSSLSDISPIGEIIINSEGGAINND